MEAGAPEFIDFLCSENEDYQLHIGGGLNWLDNACRDRYEPLFWSPRLPRKSKSSILLPTGRTPRADPSLAQGIAFFARLRQMTCDAFYTSKIGIEDLQYIGNTALAEFPGCPPIPES